MMKVLKDCGIKSTNQREEIYRYFEDNHKVKIKDLINKYPNIFPSTIYRIIDLFTEKGLISKIIDQNTIYYTLNNDLHKHYIECNQCHKRRELTTCPYNNLKLNGYKIIEDLTIKAICEDCQQKNIKYGIFVGSFNPPTIAHFAIGELLINKGYVEKVVYVPCNSLAKRNTLIPISDRYNMLESYIKNNSLLMVSDIEIKNGRENFTYRDMDILKAIYGRSLSIIIGSDNFMNLDKWEEYNYLLENYSFIVINRNNLDLSSLINEKYPKYQDKFIIIDYHNNLSSTMVRENIKKNLDINDLVSKEVYDYIINRNLYKK